MVMFRKIPLYPKLLSLGNNVWIATGVTFVLHDAIHHMLNNCTSGDEFRENIGCINIEDNVFRNKQYYPSKCDDRVEYYNWCWYFS